VFAWSYEEIPGSEPQIVQHEIRTYKNAKLVQQKSNPINSRKATLIKAKVEKMLNVCFIYPMPLMEWVSYLVLVNEK
jgi:hypothetical protein